MISVGIFTGYYPYNLEEIIAKAKGHGMNCVQLDPDQIKDVDLTPGHVTAEKAHKVRDAFRDANLPIVAISAYTNLLAKDPEKRKANIAWVKELLAHARDFGTPYVVSETGTANEDDWLYDEWNSTEEAYQAFKEVTIELAEYAYQHDAVFLIENYVNNTIGSVARTARLLREVNHPGLALMLDPTNYYDDSNIDDVDPTLNSIFDVLDQYIRVAHAKDCKRAVNTGTKFGDGGAEHNSFRGAGAVELPGAGLGVLNYELYLTRLKKNHPNIPIIIEHIDESDIPRAKKFVDDTLKKVGA